MKLLNKLILPVLICVSTIAGAQQKLGLNAVRTYDVTPAAWGLAILKH